MPIRNAMLETTRILASIFATFDADAEMVATVERCLSELFHELLAVEDDVDHRSMHPGLATLLAMLDPPRP